MNPKNTIPMLLLLSALFGCLLSNSKDTTSLNSDKLHYLALGDSYTVGESVQAKDNFPHQLVKILSENKYDYDEPEIIAKTGWRTDQLIQKVNEASLKYEKYDLVTLLVGVNDEFQGRSIEEYIPQFSKILEKAIQLAGNDSSKVWVFSIPDYGYTAYGSAQKARISPRIDQFNAVNRKLAEEKGVHYLEITTISRKGMENTGLIADDGLHPSGEMYKLWVEEFFKQFRK